MTIYQSRSRAGREQYTIIFSWGAAASLFSCGFRNVTPACGIARAAEVVLDTVLEHASLALAAFGGVLLRAKDDGLRTVETVDLIQCFIELLHLLVTLSVIVHEVRLYAVIGTDAHDDDTSPLVVIALPEDSLRTPCGRLYNLLGVIGRSEQPFLRHVPVLREVFTEMVGINEYAYGLGHGLLTPQFLGTPGRKVADMCTYCREIGDHAWK